MRRKKWIDAPPLTFAQIEIIGQFNDYSFEYPRLTFDEVVKKVLPEGFGTGPTAEQFRKDAKAIFDRERMR